MDDRAQALWELAYRAGHDAAIGELDVEPRAGVRRALCVVLAGHGQGARVLEAARSDPDPFVRGTAIQLATRLAAGGALPVADVLAAIARDPALAEHALGAIGGDAPEALRAFVLAQLGAEALDTRLEAFEALVRAGELDVARGWMTQQADVEEVCRRWLRLDSAAALAQAFAPSPAAKRARVLAAIPNAPWSAAATLIGADRALRNLVMATRGDIAVPAAELARAVLDGARGATMTRLTFQLRDARTGLAILTDVRGAARAAQVAGVRGLTARARRYVAALEIAGALETLDQLDELHPVEQLVGLEHALARWVDHGAAPADVLALVPELLALARGRLAALAGHRVLDQGLLGDDEDEDDERVEQAAFRALLAVVESLGPAK